MGTGVNVQKRLVRLHYFDPPWFPADVEQPHGRIIRQGNQNALVGIDWYATKGAYDSTMWQMVARKQRFIDQAFSGDKNLRSMEDMSEASQYEQAAAMASGDPRALQLAGYKQDLERLERLQAAHANEQIAVRDGLRSARYTIDSAEKRIAQLEAAQKVLGDNYFQFTRGTVGERAYDKLGEFGQAMKDAFNRLAKKAEGDSKHNEDGVTLGKFGPVEVLGYPSFNSKEEYTGVELFAKVGNEKMFVLSGLELGADADPVGLGRKLVNHVNGISTELDRRRQQLTENQADEKRLSKKQGVPFEHQQEMLEKNTALRQLEDELRAEGEAEAKAQQAAIAAAKPVVIKEDGSDGAEEPQQARIEPVEGAAFIGYMSADGEVFESYSHAEAEKADYHHSFLVKNLDAYDEEGALTFVRMGGKPVVSIKGTPAIDPYSDDSEWLVARLAQRIIESGGHPDMPIEVENMALPKAEAPYQGKRIGTLAQWAQRGGYELARDGDPGMSMAEMRDRIAQIRGAGAAEVQGIVNELTVGWKNGPRVHVVPTWRELPARFKPTAQFRGIHSNGQAWIVAAQHRVGTGSDVRVQVGKTLAHEVIAHYGLRQILGADFDRLLTKPLRLAIASGNKPMRELRDQVQQLYRDPDGEYHLTAHQEADEIAARAVEQAVGDDGEFRTGYSWLKAVFARVAMFLRGLGIPVKFTMAELQGMLVLAQRSLKVGERTSGGGEAIVSAAQDEAPQQARGELVQTHLGGWQSPDDTVTDKVIYELQDGRVDLKRVQQAIAARASKVEERFDARLAETLLPGRVDRRTTTSSSAR
jgi:hypothetical protein